MPRRFPIGTVLFFFFSAFTLLELWLLVLLTRATSLGFTIVLTIISALVGAALVKHEGLAVLARARNELQSGRFPAQALVDGIFILLGGALLITPGLITDGLGFSTLLPVCRRFYGRLAVAAFQKHFLHLERGVWMHGVSPGPGAHWSGGVPPEFTAPPPPSPSPSPAPSPPPRREPSGAMHPTPGPPDDDDVVDVEYREIKTPPEK